MAEKESVMEQRLIDQLTTGESQWTYRKDITTEEALWANFRQKLDQNNVGVLDGVAITDEEFHQIQQFMLDRAQTPYRAALWLSGENGEAVIPLVREDASKGTVHLMAVSSREIAGGRSSYEVINQYVSNKVDDRDRKRRFDVTLLINGIPMIQIEMKNQDHPYMDAFRQIKKYSVQGKFRGLYGMVQMFVVTNGSNTRYIAADTGEKLNENFLTPWVNHENEPVENYLAFADEVLRIPQAHEMVGHYSVLDAERKKLILLRPYQVHAIEAVKRASATGQSGFVWHTTGSGKTLTSYTVSKNLQLIPNVDKTIFLIDRKDLDQQTSLSFKAYAQNDIVDVDNTDNTGELVKKLYSNDRLVIITTIQKMQVVIKRYASEAKKDSPKTKKFRSLHVAFVVDECHRTVTPETQRDIKKFFANSMWYGFTGTPIFDENKRQQKGDLARTTEGLFGPCLHKYTIKEALHNKAVLGFQIEYKDSLSWEQVLDMGEKLGLGSADSLANGDADEVEGKVLAAYLKHEGHDAYDSDEHRMEVIDYIVNKAAGKFHLGSESGNAYEAILTVPSITIAKRYYKLIKEFVADGKVSDAIRAKCVDFPKVAITYTVSENDDGSIVNQEDMQESLDDYNKMFGTEFHIDELGGYNTNLNDRLARKKGVYQKRKNQLDLVIVVDRLLTGFDAPPCAILFVDRPTMAPQNLIQAFSRTNRLYDKTKRYGMIVIFQRSEEYRKAVDDALLLYSNGGTNDVSAPSFEETEKKFKAALKELHAIAKKPADVDKLLSDTDQMKKFARAFQKLDRLYGEVQVYQDWEGKSLGDYHTSEEELQDFQGKYQNVIEELKRLTGDGAGDGDGDSTAIDVEYELETITSVTIDYRYIVSLIQSHMPKKDELVTEPIEDKEIDKHIEKLRDTNPALADVISDFWEDMKRDPSKYRGMDAMTVIETRIDEIINEQIDDFVREWCTQKKDVIAILNTFKQGDSVSIVTDYDTFKAAHEGVSKLQYKRRAKEAVVKLVETIRPLCER